MASSQPAATLCAVAAGPVTTTDWPQLATTHRWPGVPRVINSAIAQPLSPVGSGAGGGAGIASWPANWLQAARTNGSPGVPVAATSPVAQPCAAANAPAAGLTWVITGA